MRPLMPPLALSLLLLPVLGCKQKAAQGPEWLRTAPAGTQLGISGSAGWLLDQQQFQALVARNPLAEQVLELFLKQARISPKVESGRISFYVLELPKGTKEPGSPKADLGTFLIQLGQFKDPMALQATLAGSFPPEGSLMVGGREFPLHVVLDYNEVHVRAMSDGSGRIWLGEMKALNQLAQQGFMPAGHGLLRAAAWTHETAPLQGFILPQAFKLQLKDEPVGNLARELPEGITGLAWSVTPGQEKNRLHRMELAVCGEPNGISQVTPWLQRIGALASTQQDAGQAPELMQERDRVGLRCQLTDTQVTQLMAKLNQPQFKFSSHPGTPKP